MGGVNTPCVKIRSFRLKRPGSPGAVREALTEVLREGARQLLESAIEAEVSAVLERFQREKTAEGLSRMVRNGRLPSRTIQTGIGAIEVAVPRIRDREHQVRFRSSILPPYLAADQDHRGVVAVVVSEGDLHGGLSGGADGVAGQGCSRLVGQHDQSAEGGLEGRAAALVAP